MSPFPRDDAQSPMLVTSCAGELLGAWVEAKPVLGTSVALAACGVDVAAVGARDGEGLDAGEELPGELRRLTQGATVMRGCSLNHAAVLHLVEQ